MSLHHLSGLKQPAWTQSELDARHDEIVARYPGGLTYKQWRRIALESAREDDVVHPHPVGDFSVRTSLMIKLLLEGYVERRCRPDEVGPWYITKAGRAFLASGAES